MRQAEQQIAIYSRKSKFTGKGESIGNQIELCRDYVRGMFGKEQAERCVIFEDEGFSGGNLRRPDFQKMLRLVRQGQFKAIVVYRLDRISRNISDFTNLIEELTKLNVSFISIREQFDTSTPMGRAMMFIISVFSQLERETIAERIRDNMHELAKTGRWLGGNTPTGYTSESICYASVDGKTRKMCHLKPVSQEAETVKAIFRTYLETGSLTATESELLRQNRKTKNGKYFTRFSIKAILQNPVYTEADERIYDYFVGNGADVCTDKASFDGSRGVMPYNRTDQEKGRTTVQLPMEDWIIAAGTHPPFIAASEWIRTQQMLARNGKKSYRKPRSHASLLAGRIYCVCGARMRPKLTGRQTPQGEPQFHYVCRAKEQTHMRQCQSRNVDGNLLDSLVFSQLKQLSWDPDQMKKRLQAYCQHCRSEIRQKHGQIQELRQAQTDNRKKRDGLIDSLSVVEGTEAKRQVAKRIEILLNLDRELEEQIREQEINMSVNSATDLDMYTFHDILVEMPPEFRRQAAAQLIERVTWDGDTAHIVLFGGQIPEAILGTLCEDSK